MGLHAQSEACHLEREPGDDDDVFDERGLLIFREDASYHHPLIIAI